MDETPAGPEAVLARLRSLDLAQLAVEAMTDGFGPTLTAGWTGQAGTSSVEKVLEALVPGSAPTSAIVRCGASW